MGEFEISTTIRAIVRSRRSRRDARRATVARGARVLTVASPSSAPLARADEESIDRAIKVRHDF